MDAYDTFLEPGTGSLCFIVEYKGKIYYPRISAEALQDHFGADGCGHEDLEEAYLSGCQEINSLALKRIAVGDERPLLKTHDF